MDKPTRHGLDYSTHFDNEREELRFRQCRGIALHWEGRLEAATVELDRALELALGLGGEVSCSAVCWDGWACWLLSRAIPLKHRAITRVLLPLRAMPGSEPCYIAIWRLLYSELGERAKAGVEFGRWPGRSWPRAKKDWPLPDPQNWLRIKLFGLGIPLWNFGDFHTGAGVVSLGTGAGTLAAGGAGG